MRPAVPRSQAGEKSLSDRSDEEEAPALEEVDTVLLGVEAHNDQARPLNVDRLPDADFFNGACRAHVACRVAIRGGHRWQPWCGHELTPLCLVLLCPTSL